MTALGWSLLVGWFVLSRGALLVLVHRWLVRATQTFGSPYVSPTDVGMLMVFLLPGVGDLIGGIALGYMLLTESYTATVDFVVRTYVKRYRMQGK